MRRRSGEIEEVSDVSTEDIADAEEAESASDAFTDADAREERIELRNDSIDELVDQAQEVSDEGIDCGRSRPWVAEVRCGRQSFGVAKFAISGIIAVWTNSFFDEADMNS